jgi:hypothetical protein
MHVCVGRSSYYSWAAMDSDSDEGELPPLLGPERASAPNVPSIPRAPDAKPPAPAKAPSAPSVPPAKLASKPGSDLKPSSGFKKGFLSGGGSSSSGRASKSTAKRADSDGLHTLKADAAAKTKSLELPEVQSKLEAEKAEAAKVGANGGPAWMTPELLQKIASKPILRKAFTDPKCQAAMTELQTNPEAAMRKYGDVPEMREVRCRPSNSGP